MTAELFAFVQKQVLDSQAQVLERLGSIDKHLAELNGRVAQNARDVSVAKVVSDALQAEYVKHCVALAVLEERNKFQQQQLVDAKIDTKEQLGEQKADTKDLLAKVLDLSWKVASVMSALALITKMANIW